MIWGTRNRVTVYKGPGVLGFLGPEYLQPLYCLILDDLDFLISLLWIASTTMLTGSIEP